MENAVSGHVEEALQDPVGAENGFEPFIMCQNVSFVTKAGKNRSFARCYVM